MSHLSSDIGDITESHDTYMEIAISSGMVMGLHNNKIIRFYAVSVGGDIEVRYRPLIAMANILTFLLLPVLLGLIGTLAVIVSTDYSAAIRGRYFILDVSQGKW
jgi:hypothetical protein